MAAPTAPAAPPAQGSVTLYDKSGAPVVVDAADAPGHILSGQLGYAPGTRVPVRVNGEIGTVDADQLGEAVTTSKATTVTGKEFHEHEQQKKYGSTAQAAEAFGVNALDSATIGASNALIGGLGGKGTREYLRGITEANPTAATAGDVAGFVAPIAADVLTGGALTPGIAAAEAARVAERGIVRGVADAGLSALRAPTKLVSGIGGIAEGVAKSVVGHGSESATARVAQNIIAGGVRGIAEGGIYGVGQEVGHQFLQDDPDFSGEALGSAWWQGAALGGALGGALHGGAGLLAKRAPALERALETEGQVGASAAAKESTVTDKAAKAILSQVDDPKTRATLEKAWEDRGPHGFAKHDDLLVDATRKISNDLDMSLKAGHEVDLASFGEAKSNQMAKLVPAENLQPARASAMKVWDDAKTVIGELESQTMKGGHEAGVKRLGKWLGDFQEKMEAAKDPAKLFDLVDDFKRRIGKESGFGRQVFGREEATARFNELYDRVRISLEDETTWGAAATAQKDINLATADMLGTSRKFESGYATQYGSKAGEPVFVADPAKIDGFVKGLTSPAQDLNAQKFADYVSKRGAFLDAVEKNYKFPPEVNAAVAAERKALASMSKTIASTGTEVSQINKLKSLLADEKGHSIHGLIGMAIDTVTKPGLTLARLAELEATKNRALTKIQSGFDSIKSALGGTGERRKPGLAPKLPDSPDTYEKRRGAILSAASQPDALHAHLQGASAPLGSAAPATSQAFQRAGIRTVQYLMGELPKPPPRPGSLTPQLDAENWQASDQQKAQYNRKFDAATHPTYLLDFVANGTITTQHVEAVRATNPATYAKMSQQLQGELKTLKKPVPEHLQGPIKTFLGIPKMDPELQRLMQANYVSPPHQSPQATHATGLKRPLKMADNTSLNAKKERL